MTSATEVETAALANCTCSHPLSFTAALAIHSIPIILLKACISLISHYIYHLTLAVAIFIITFMVSYLNMCSVELPVGDNTVESR